MVLDPHADYGIRDNDLLVQVTDDGGLAAWQDWDTGKPGEANRDAVFVFGCRYYVVNLDGLWGPFGSRRDAVAFGRIDLFTDATVAVGYEEPRPPLKSDEWLWDLLGRLKKTKTLLCACNGGACEVWITS